MILIGEKINGSIPSVAKAIAERNEDWIRNLAKIQTEAGADFIDVCASVKDNEVETLHWLIDLVQEVTDTPICIDSPDASVCVEAMKFCKKPGLINSVSMEGNKVDIIFPAIAGTTWQCVALLCAKGIPQSAEERLTVFDQLMAKAKEYNIAPSRLHIDPLVEMLCTSEDLRRQCGPDVRLPADPAILLRIGLPSGLLRICPFLRFCSREGRA